MSDLSDKSFASTRSHQDAKSANDFARAAAQAVILINGGAATALIAYSAHMESGQELLASAIAWALIGYAIGAFFGALMFLLMWHWLEVWMLYWESRAGDYKKDMGKPESRTLKIGQKMWRFSIHATFILGMACFIASTVYVAMNGLALHSNQLSGAGVGKIRGK